MEHPAIKLNSVLNSAVHTVCFVRTERTLAATISQRSGARADRIARGGMGDAKRGDGALDRSRGGTAGAHDLEIRTEADNAPVQRDIAMVPLASFVARCAIPDDWPVSQTQPALIRQSAWRADRFPDHVGWVGHELYGS